MDYSQFQILPEMQINCKDGPSSVSNILHVHPQKYLKKDLLMKAEKFHVQLFRNNCMLREGTMCGHSF